MRFADPLWLHGLWAVPVLAALAVRAQIRRRRTLARLGDVALLDRLAPAASAERRGLRAALAIAATALFSVALARPQWGEREEPIRRAGVDVFLAVDVSLSMLAEDVRPSRLVRARLAMTSFLDRVAGDRVGLIVFGGTAQVICPLTLDAAAVQSLLEVADPASVSDTGTRLAEAVDLALDSFPKGGAGRKVIVLLTDGEDQGSEPLRAAERARREGVTIFAVGLGTPRGEPIPIRDESGQVRAYKKDEKGELVTSRLDEPVLAELARVTGGEYYRGTAGESEIERIAAAIDEMEKTEFEEKLRQSYRERFGIPLAAGVLLLGLAFAIPEARRSPDDAPPASARRANP